MSLELQGKVSKGAEIILAQANPEPPSPRSFLAGSDTHLRLRFSSYRLSAGPWRLRVLIRDRPASSTP